MQSCDMVNCEMEVGDQIEEGGRSSITEDLGSHAEELDLIL